MKPLVILAALAVALSGCSKESTEPTAATPAPINTSAKAEPAAQDTSNPNLIKPGTALPDLTLSGVDGKPVQVASYLKDKKGLLLNFWFYT